MRGAFTHLSTVTQGRNKMGASYFVGNSKEEFVKLDIYYTDPFIRHPLIIEGIRMATVEEIIAMKIDVIQRSGRKKDFWDLHELLDKYSPKQMIRLHAERYPYSHDEALIKLNFTDFSKADDDFEPICLRGKHWEVIRLEIAEAVT